MSVTTSLDGYQSVDQDLPVAEERSLSEIAAAVREGDRSKKEASDDEDREENDNNPAQPTTSKEAAAAYEL